MNRKALQHLCKSLPHVTEDIKWGDDLCFCIGAKLPAKVKKELHL